MRLLFTLTMSLCLCATSALAADLSTVVAGPDGIAVADDLAPGNQGIVCGEKDAKACLTIGRAVVHALLLCSGPPFCPSQHPNGEDKYRRAKLADKVERDPTAVQLTADEVTVVKSVTGDMYSPAVVRAVWDAVEPPR